MIVTPVRSTCVAVGEEKNRRGRHDVFFFLLFFLLASPFIYSSFDRLLLAISEKENAFSDVAGRGEREGGRVEGKELITLQRHLAV